MTTSAALIEVEPSAVRAAGITPGRCMVWALEKHKDGKHEQALRLLDAAAALIREEAAR